MVSRPLLTRLPCIAGCLFELYTAIGERGAVQIEVILTDEQYKDFVEAMSTQGYGAIDTAVCCLG